MNNLVCRPKSADIIIIDEDDSAPSIRKRSPTGFEHDDELEPFAESLVGRRHCELETAFEDH